MKNLDKLIEKIEKKAERKNVTFNSAIIYDDLVSQLKAVKFDFMTIKDVINNLMINKSDAFRLNVSNEVKIYTNLIDLVQSELA